MKFSSFWFVISLLTLSSAAAAPTPSAERALHLLNSPMFGKQSLWLSKKGFFFRHIELSNDQVYNGSTTFDVTFVSNSSYQACLMTVRVGHVEDETRLELVQNNCR